LQVIHQFSQVDLTGVSARAGVHVRENVLQR
jgi:hypothetical protein